MAPLTAARVDLSVMTLAFVDDSYLPIGNTRMNPPKIFADTDSLLEFP
jgi:hypothetical protein